MDSKNYIKKTHNFLEVESIKGLISLFPDVNTFTLPSLITRDITRLLRTKKNYSQISNNRVLAIEKCLYMISDLTSTLFSDSKFKPLKSEVLHEQLKSGNDNTFIYRKVITLLIDNNFIEVKTNDNKESYRTGVQSKQYKLNDKYIKPLVKTYDIQSNEIIQKRNTIFYKTLKLSLSNPICNNLINIYGSIKVPTIEEIMKEAKRLIKLDYRTKKGKVLTLRNKHAKEYWKDSDNRSFVEDSIKIFEYYTKRGFMIPTEGSWKSGGRIVDSFTLMPSWIRALIKINGSKLIELDYRTLHPNIVSTLYNGYGTNISHDIVSNYLCIDRMTTKIEHLSFWNKRVNDMKKSKLFKYYSDNEREMLNNVINEKLSKSYKTTSKRLFKTEVTLMTKVIQQLNENGINAIYVYDALMVELKYEERAEYLMNTIAKDMGINTTV